MSALKALLLFTICLPSTDAWISQKPALHSTSTFTSPLTSTSLQSSTTVGNIHGQGACFLPLKQLDMDYLAPRIVQIAGAYPGLTREEFFAVSSEPAPDKGQWTYDFSDPDGPQLGTVAIEGSQLVADCQDPVVIIAEHPSLGVELPEAIQGAVDLVVLVDRGLTAFAERRFMVLSTPGTEQVQIAAFGSKKEMPEGTEILGQVLLVQIPWLPSMKPTKTGFMEADEYF